MQATTRNNLQNEWRLPRPCHRYHFTERGSPPALAPGLVRLRLALHPLHVGPAALLGSLFLPPVASVVLDDCIWPLSDSLTAFSFPHFLNAGRTRVQSLVLFFSVSSPPQLPLASFGLGALPKASALNAQLSARHPQTDAPLGPSQKSDTVPRFVPLFLLCW